jgi:hypothetical protein
MLDKIIWYAVYDKRRNCYYNFKYKYFAAALVPNSLWPIEETAISTVLDTTSATEQDLELQEYR